VYIFIEQNVYSEYPTYKKNKDKDLEWAHVNNKAIFEFIDELHDLYSNNAIFSFDTSHSIVDILRSQWAGLFQRFLQDRSYSDQAAAATALSEGLNTLRQIIDKMSPATDADQTKITELSAVQHPIFQKLRKILKVTYRVFFLTDKEMSEWLKGRGWKNVEKGSWDNDDTQEWIREKDFTGPGVVDLLKISNEVFSSDGVLKPEKDIPWSDELVKMVKYDHDSNTTLE
jgi:hypothetical protein